MKIFQSAFNWFYFLFIAFTHLFLLSWMQGHLLSSFNINMPLLLNPSGPAVDTTERPHKSVQQAAFYLLTCYSIPAFEASEQKKAPLMHTKHQESQFLTHHLTITMLFLDQNKNTIILVLLKLLFSK